MEPLEWWRVWTQVAVVGSGCLFALLRPLPVLRIVCACIATMVAYGVVQDQFSARLCPEYFTVAHPPLPGLTDPTLLGLAWGFLGSWWGGLFLGIAVVIPARVGKRPPLGVRDLAPGLLALVAFVAATTLICGAAAHQVTGIAGWNLTGPYAEAIPAESRRHFLVVACAHFGTYAASVLGAVVLSAHTGLRRAVRISTPPAPNRLTESHS